MCCGVGWCVDVEGLWVVVLVSGGGGWAEREDCGWSGGSGEVGGWHVIVVGRVAGARAGRSVWIEKVFERILAHA